MLRASFLDSDAAAAGEKSRQRMGTVKLKFACTHGYTGTQHSRMSRLGRERAAGDGGDRVDSDLSVSDVSSDTDSRQVGKF